MIIIGVEVVLVFNWVKDWGIGLLFGRWVRVNKGVWRFKVKKVEGWSWSVILVGKSVCSVNLSLVLEFLLSTVVLVGDFSIGEVKKDGFLGFGKLVWFNW